ncbi:AraC family ligand binding domain-containing protein [Streptomyces avidinii]|uniref:AraC family ligand binding domain-containing protein n=1 Tax=Streptomyces avidinii TaxID=1895 RepID=UPI0037955B84
MDTPVSGTPVFLAPRPAEPSGSAPVAVVWTLGDPGRDLDAKLVRLSAGAVVEEHTEAVLGVLVLVVGGSGEIRTPDRTVALTPGCAAWLPAGTAHALRAGAEGLACTTAHRRRPPATALAGPGPDAGEPACLLHLVCDACGRLATDRDARFCTRCGTRLPGPDRNRSA